MTFLRVSFDDDESYTTDVESFCRELVPLEVALVRDLMPCEAVYLGGGDRGPGCLVQRLPSRFA